MYHNATHNIGLGSYNDDKFKVAIYDCDLQTDNTQNNFKGLEIELGFVALTGFLFKEQLFADKNQLFAYKIQLFVRVGSSVSVTSVTEFSVVISVTEFSLVSVRLETGSSLSFSSPDFLWLATPPSGSVLSSGAVARSGLSVAAI